MINQAQNKPDQESQIIKKKKPSLNKKQQIFTEAFMSGKYRYMYFGGAMGGGKSYLVIGLLIQLCQDYPMFKGVVLRKSRTTIESTSLETAWQIFGNLGLTVDIDFTFNATKMIFKFNNGSRLRFQEADLSKDPRLLKLHGLEESMAVMEEANEMEEAVFSKIITRLRWKADTKVSLPRMVLLTSNPDNNWVKTKFYDPWAAGTLQAPYYYLPALPHENEFLDKDYLQSLENLPESEYRRNVLGDWNYADSPNQLINYEQFEKIKLTSTPERVPTILGIDVAREGNDSTVGTLGDMQGVISWDIQKIRDFNTSAEYWINNVINRYGIKPEDVLVDACGLGCGLIDAFANRGVYVGSFKSSDRARTQLKTERRMPDGTITRTTMAESFADAKAESFWFLREDIEDQLITIPDNAQFKREMFVQKYKIKGGKIFIEDKASVKKANGNASPDMFDSTVIFNYQRRNKALNGGFSMGYTDQIFNTAIKDQLGLYSRKYYKYQTAVKQMIY